MKRHARNKKQLWRIFGVLTVGIMVFAGAGVFTRSALALTYQSSIGVNFTIEPSISVSLSSSTIHIDNLAPGNSADSNVITVNVISGAANGYSLNSTVGNSTYKNRDLTNEDDSTAKFTSVDFGASVDYTAGGTNLTEKKWGYTYSKDGTTWNKYSGLPLYSDGTNVATLMTGAEATSASGDSVQFKIAAKAATGQALGEYKNVINFVAVAEPEKTYYMQDVATWGETLAVGDTVEAIDDRDGKSYLVTRLADDNIWMTQNLDLDLDSNTTYTSEDTDISNDWTPSTSTYVSSDTTWNATESTPESYDPGDLCWNGTIDTSSGTLDTMTTKCSESSANKHWSVGNYYNWTAAVAMNDSSSYTTKDTDVDQSICPAGWRLPTVSDNYSFQKLLNESGYSVSSGTSGSIQSDPFYFVYGGYWDGSSGDVGGYGLYWSSVVYASSLAYDLYFDADGALNPQSLDNRNGGASVRCVAR